MPPSFQKLKRLRTQLGGGSATDVETPFDVECKCGARVTGLRRATWIEAECPKCSHGVFVLPVNVYPATPSVSSEILGGPFSERLKTVVSELLPDRKTVDEPEDIKQRKRKTRRGGVASDADTRAATDAQTSPDVDQPRRRTLQMPQFDVKAALRRTCTPFRLLMLGMVAVVGLTGYWMAYQQQVEAARQTWLRSAEDIDDFLAASDVIQLEAVLQESVDAGYLLGKNDAEWRSRLNLLQETKAINNLAMTDLLTDFAGAYDDQDRLVADAEQQLLTAVTSGWFVFDSWLTAASNQTGVYLMELPAAPGRHPVDAYVPLPQLADLISHADDERAVFAVRFQAVQAPAAQSHEAWRLLVDPPSFVLLTSETHCESVGLNTSDDTDLSAVLSRQKEFVESSETWEHRASDSVVPLDFAAKTEDGTKGWNDED
ncbi:hypothetical protein [Fuerstiella marisgermanici]|uniref:Uncharacterized protein n=1 Tax=Fuerstiella marisgermanici TaxID=1891926 RepID=A0A1P8WJS1_9PLAN|nr:hypothetical protein [Fuerstiella marisgermanici]APZ94309.1 hypothetical protein Fuma_03935 [Fuerstiella marisgermanici]